MKTAFLLHGNGGSDQDYFWFADTKSYLESKDYTVWWPLLPNTDDPTIGETVEYIQENAPEITDETIMIGHSSAAPVILEVLRQMEPGKTIDKAIVVSGFYSQRRDWPAPDPMVPADGFAWEEIKQHAKEIILINSDNDPWGCDDVKARPAAEALGAKFILAEGQGHMGSITYNQPYREFPLLKKLLT